ncbi:MAG: autotransporter domain-containing protein [Candidatus Dadabacteria bacterium]|nr:autotransporter domain-containing protein [Candidatus Dadabacteria bacterium]
MAGRYGVRMSGAGISDSVHIPDDPNSPIPEGSIISLRNQVVEVYGELESTGPDGAAIALRGGGHVFVGADTILRSASGTTIKIDEADPGTNLIIQIKMKEGENIAGTFSRAVPGRIVNSSTTRAWVEDENGNFSLVPARTQPRPITPPILPTDSTDPTDPDPTDSTDPTDPDPEPGKESQPEPEPELQPTPPPNPAERMVQGPYDAWMDCDGTMCETHTIFAPRARVYEALPAVLLDMNSVSWRDGLMRDESGTWTGTIASSANRDLKNSTTNTSYDVDRIGVILGHDFETNDSETLGVFFQYQKGTAEIADGGKIDGHAMGAGVKYRRDFDPLTIGLRASIISFTNDLSSSLRGQLATGIIGTRYAVGMEAGNEIALSDAVLMLDAGLTYARVSANDFTSVLKDPNALSGTAEVKVTDISGEETALHARAEYRRTDLQWPVFAGAGLEIPLDSRAEVRVGNTLLSSERRIGASLHGGIALDDRIGGGDAALSLRYAKQGGGDTIQVNLTYGF